MSDIISDTNELLFRQVHPSFIDNGEPTSQAFRPTQKDRGKLSVDRSSLTTAKNSFDLFVENGFQSDAVYGLTVGEFNKENINCFPDPLDTNPINPAHASADFSSFGNSDQKKIAKRLKSKATTRGQLYP